MKKETSVPFVIFSRLFMISITIFLIGRGLCVRNTQNYWDLQPELFAPDEISTVLYDDDQEQLYVCYSDSSYVNVYTESGEFLWAVSVPIWKNPYYELQEKRLIIYDREDVYIYNSTDGSFIECANAEDLTLEFDREDEKTIRYQKGEFYFDTYQVYKVHSDGTKEAVITRPWWYWCFNMKLCWCIAFPCGIGINIYKIIKEKEKQKENKRLRPHV